LIISILKAKKKLKPRNKRIFSFISF